MVTVLSLAPSLTTVYFIGLCERRRFVLRPRWLQCPGECRVTQDLVTLPVHVLLNGSGGSHYARSARQGLVLLGVLQTESEPRKILIDVGAVLLAASVF